MKKNVAGQVIGAELISKTDGSPVTSGTTTVYYTGDGGSQTSGGGSVTHKGNGYWSYAPAQAETNFAHVAFTFVNSAAINVTVQVYTSIAQSECELALVAKGLDHLVSASVTGTDIVDNSIVAQLVSKTGDWDTYDKSTDSLQANSEDAATVADIADGVCDEALTGHTTSGTVGERLNRIPNANPATSGGLPTVDSNNAVKIQSGTGTGQIQLASGNVTVGTNTDKTGYGLSAAERTSTADVLLNRDMSAVSDTNSRTPLNAMRFLRNRWVHSSGSLTVYEEDDSTVAWTSTITTDAAAIPIVGSNPAGGSV